MITFPPPPGTTLEVERQQQHKTLKQRVTMELELCNVKDNFFNFNLLRIALWLPGTISGLVKALIQMNKEEKNIDGGSIKTVDRIATFIRLYKLTGSLPKNKPKT